jgi:23S rRNA (cytidine1920-2'-O)/16S rRNA (cytidine1409-2'-O)-methyltransferase
VTRTGRTRLDQLLVDRGLAETRARAQALVMGGRVRVGAGDGARSSLKAGDIVDAAVPVAVAAPLPYVSRGGEKLAAALDEFAIDPAGLVCLDVGASTGGFSDVLLQRGAARVHAVDVGRGQLAESLRRDPRTVVHDRLNARTLRPALVGEPIDLAVVDVSFISLGLVLGPIATCLRPGGRIVALVKPQFEAGRGKAPRGVVRDPEVHRAVLARTLGTARGLGLRPLGLAASPLLGPAGNREFFVALGVEEGSVAPGGPPGDASGAGLAGTESGVEGEDPWRARIAVLVGR